MDEELKPEKGLIAGQEKVSEAVMQDVDPKAIKEHWVYLEEFCMVCLKRRVYFFMQLPVKRIAAFCCGECRAKFDLKSNYYIDRKNQFMKYLQEEERNEHKGAVDRALQRVLNPDNSVR